MPDELVREKQQLGDDTDDDNDDWTDEQESSCGTNSKDSSSVPLDGDDDGSATLLMTRL